MTKLTKQQKFVFWADHIQSQHPPSLSQQDYCHVRGAHDPSADL